MSWFLWYIQPPLSSSELSEAEFSPKNTLGGQTYWKEPECNSNRFTLHAHCGSSLQVSDQTIFFHMALLHSKLSKEITIVSADTGLVDIMAHIDKRPVVFVDPHKPDPSIFIDC